MRSVILSWPLRRARSSFAPSPPPRRKRFSPAPSKWAYRMQRLWLTPRVRFGVCVVLPVLVAVLCGALFLASAERRADLLARGQALRDAFVVRPELMVSAVAVTGAAPELAEAVRARLGAKLPLSAFDLDLNGSRAMIESLDAVARASLSIRKDGVLEVAITERAPAILWRSPRGLEMLDAQGRRVASLTSRADRPDLPLMVGEGADRAAREAMALLAAARPLEPRLRALVRVSARRWDLVLDRDQRILLPEDAPITALKNLLALEKSQDLLARDILGVDLRNPARPTLRLAPGAQKSHRQRQAELQEGGGGL